MPANFSVLDSIANGMVANLDKTKCSAIKGQPIVFLGSTEPLGLYISNDLNWVSHVEIQLNKARRAFYALKSRIPFNTPSRTKLNLYRALVISILIYGIPAWFPDITRLKEMERFQKSCFRWVFGHQQSYEFELKINQFLPICHRIELLTFVMLNNLINRRYKYDCATYISFRKNLREMRTGVTNVLNCGYSTLSHQKAFFIRSAEMVNLFRHNIIDGFDNENMKSFKIFLLANSFQMDHVCSFSICCRYNICKYSRSVC